LNLKDTDDKKQKTVCDKVKGKLCNGDCFLTTAATKEEEVNSQFEKTCAELKDSRGGSYIAMVYVYPTKELAVKYSSKCDASVFT
jgi:hypothetical protein